MESKGSSCKGGERWRMLKKINVEAGKRGVELHVQFKSNYPSPVSTIQRQRALIADPNTHTHTHAEIFTSFKLFTILIHNKRFLLEAPADLLKSITALTLDGNCCNQLWLIFLLHRNIA